MKALSTYQGQIALLRKEREKLDVDFAQVIAEALNDGHAIIDLIAPKNMGATKDFDL